MSLSDYGAIMRSGAALVPDYAQQQAQQQELAIRRDQVAGQQAQLQQRVAEAQRQIEGEAAWQQDWAAYQQNPTAEGLANLAGKYPDRSEAIKRSYDMRDKAANDADGRVMFSIGNRLKAGDTEGAARILEDRIKADPTPDPEDQDRLEALRSGDPAAIKRVLGEVAFALRSTGDAGSKAADELLPKAELRETGGIVWDANNGSVIGQLPGQSLVVPDGGQVFPRSVEGIPMLGGGLAAPVAVPAKGGGQVSGGAGAGGGSTGSRGVPPKLAPLDLKAASSVGGQFGTVTSTVRSPEHNRKVGGTKNSWHLKGRAIDIARKPGVSHAQVVEGYRRAGFQVLEQLDEGDHSHLAFAAGPSKAGGPVHVRSVQQYNKLPSGAQYYDPNGKLRVKG